MTKTNGILSAWAGFTVGIIGAFTYITRKQRQAEAEITAELDAIFAEDEFDDDFSDVERHFTQRYNVGDPVYTEEYESWSTGETHPPITDATVTHAQYDAGFGEWVYGIDKAKGLFVGGALKYDEKRATAMLRDQEAALLREIDDLLDRKNETAAMYRLTGDAEYEEQGRQIGVTLTGKATALAQVRRQIDGDGEEVPPEE